MFCNKKNLDTDPYFYFGRIWIREKVTWIRSTGCEAADFVRRIVNFLDTKQYIFIHLWWKDLP